MARCLRRFLLPPSAPLVLLVTLGLTSRAAAPSPLDFTIRNWQAKDGLPQNSVRCLAQTRDGYLWLGTFDGLARFDGVRFTLFTLANVPDLRSHNVNALLEDRDGTLWIGTETGGLSHYRSGHFGSVPRTAGLDTDTIWSLSEDANGVLWVGSPDGVFRSDGPRFVSVPVPIPKGSPKRTFKPQPTPDGDVCFWGDGGLVIGRHGQFVHPPGWTNNITVLEADRTGTLWCWVRYQGLFEIRNGLPTHHPEVKADFATALHIAPDGALWIADRSCGLTRWHNGETTVFTTANGLATDDVSSLVHDREGNLWVGTNGGGLHRLRPRRLRVYSKRDGLASDDVMSVCAGPDGSLWIGTFGGGLNRLDKDGTLRTHWWRDHDNVVALDQAPDGPLWVGTYANGLVLYFGESLRKSPNPCGPIIRALFRDRQDRLWVGSSRHGLHCLSEGGWTNYSTAQGLSHSTVTCIVEDHERQIWIGTSQGLNRFAGGCFTRFGRADGLLVEAIHSLFVDSAGALWVGTSGGGLARRWGDRFRSITTQHGLVSDVIAQILEDDTGHLWLGSNGGIMRVARDELNQCAEGTLATVLCDRYGQSEGLPRVECTGGYQPACLKDRDRRLWFCTVGGLAVVDPTDIRRNTLEPPVFIEAVVLDEQPFSVRSPQETSPNPDNPAPTGPSAPALAEIRVPPRVHRLEFRYTAVTFTAPERARFRYRLEGWDTDWIDAGTRRVAYYTRVRPGQYQFRVIACNDSGVWNNTGASVAVAILAPWYRTWWAVSLGGLLATGILVTSYEARLHHLRRVRAQQAAFSRGLLDCQEAERRRLAKELHDGLGQDLVLIRNHAELGLRQQALTGGQSEPLVRISRAAAAALDVVRSTARALHPYELERLGLTRALEEMVRRAGETSTTTFLCDFDDVAGLFPPETQINVYRILQEGVTNILKHARATEVLFELKREATAVRASLLDNGGGFDPNGPHSSPRCGLGFQGMTERAGIIGARLTVQSAPGRGTRLELTLPLPHPPHG
ncbi:MAG TPA: two-component regulator propeller domain-containing protein [Verrucomicrobiota bacterium]|nr:two-component regulator propeller domain-containing protein [Verrucomicrobiota bacterium]HNU51359.1 two-component regulator propeller domain-containing protein [Verrucomicrobiota bacterium]